MRIAMYASSAFAAAVAAICVVPAALADDAKAAGDPLAGFERTGEKTACLMSSQIDQIKPVTDELFLVRVGVSTWYLNEVSGSCNGASSGFTRLEYRTSGSSLCRLQIVNVVDNNGGFFRGSCSLGDFEKLKQKPKAQQPKSE